MHENTIADISFKTYTDTATTKIFLLPGFETCLNFSSGKKSSWNFAPEDFGA